MTGNRIRQAHRADETGARAGGGEDLLFAGQHGFVRQLGQLAGLDLVDLVIAAQAQRDQAVAAAHQHGLHALLSAIP